MRKYKISLPTYKKRKLSLLRQLGIHLNQAQIDHLENCLNEIQVDNFARSLIFK